MTAIVGTVLILAVVMRRDQLPRITFESLDAAAARWAANGPPDYDMDLHLTGVNPGEVHVEVRDGQVTKMTLNGHPTRQHLWDDWSVPGLFAVIRRDLEVCMAEETNPELLIPKSELARPRPGPSPEGGPPRNIVYPRGIFDDRLGYPTAYHRVAPGRGDAKWRVTQFDPR
jgi:hypothetical protein